LRFNVILDGEEYEVQTVGEPGTVVLDGQRFEGTVERPSKDRRVISMGESRYDVKVVEGEVSEGTFYLELAGERIKVQLSQISMRTVRAPVVTKKKAKVRKKAEKDEDDEDDEISGEGIRAPMPGRVVEVFVEAGEEVEAGDVVLILEAMKMENELRSPGKATVKSVNVKPGDMVAGNQLLVALD
jgi:pyruvate carboxylase subunit B